MNITSCYFYLQQTLLLYDIRYEVNGRKILGAFREKCNLSRCLRVIQRWTFSSVRRGGQCCRFCPQVRVLYSYVPGRRAYSLTRQGEAGRSETDARLYSVDGLAARKPNLLFYGARICSNLQRLETPLCWGRKKKARERRAFLLLLLFAEERKFPSASSLASFIRQSTEQYRRKEEGKTRDCQLLIDIRESYCV